MSVPGGPPMRAYGMVGHTHRAVAVGTGLRAPLVLGSLGPLPGAFQRRGRPVILSSCPIP